MRHLSTIVSAAGHISLIRGRHARRDAPGEYALSEIQVKDQNHRIVKRFYFDYAYFGPTAATDPNEVRLKLVQVKEQASGCAATATRFDYKETTSVSRTTALRDYWGYFTQLTPGGRGYLPKQTPHAEAMQNCLLERITTSAGSVTAMTYEPHLDHRGIQIGGVRLKKVVLHDGLRVAADQVFEVGYTVFDRHNPGLVGGPSSPSIDPPRYAETQQTRVPGDKLCDSSDDIIKDYVFTSSDPLEPIAPDYVGYQWAHVRFPNGSRSVYKFTNQFDFPDTQNSESIKLDARPYDKVEPCHSQQVNLPPVEAFIGCNLGDPRSSYNRGPYVYLPPAERPYGIKSSAAHRRGIVLEQYELDSENRLVTSTSNSYDFSHRDVALRSVVMAKEQEVFAYAIFNWYYNIKFYDLERQWTPLQEQVITAYDQRRGNTQPIAQSQQRTTYEYANYLLAAVTTSRPTDGKRYRTQYLRVADYAPGYRAYPPGVRELYDKHNRTTVLSTEQFIQPASGAPLQRTARTVHEYLMHNNVPLPSRTVSYDYVAGGVRPVGQNSVAAVVYDNQNNLVNALATNGVWGGTIYGYNQLLPIASVVNGRVSASASNAMGVATPTYTSFETEGDGGWSTGAAYAAEAKTGQRSVRLSAASAMYGPGKTFTLEPTEQHGKYVFSCWAKVPQGEAGQSNVTMVTVIHAPNGNSIWRGTTTYNNSGQPWQLCRGIVDLEEPAIRAALTSTQNISIQCYPWISAGSGNVLVDEMRFHPEKDWLSTQAPTTPGSATAGHTSFETDNDDGWSYRPAFTGEAKTGQRSVQLTAASDIYGPGKTFTLEPADQRGKYVFSCWVKVPKGEAGSAQVTMVTFISVPSGSNTWRGASTYISSGQEWQLCRAVIDLDEPAIRNTLPTSGNITIHCYPYIASGNGHVLVDEVRFHPENARMTTSTYQPFVGKTSTTDANGVTTYFLYDDNNELRLVKDAKGQIVKRISSHIAGAPDITVQVATTGGNAYPGAAVTFTASTPDCAEGVTYTWNFGDGTSRKKVGAEQTHTYPQVGSYALTVVAEAPGVQPVEATHTVQVVSPLTAGAWYYGTTYYDLCNPNGGDRSATITAVPAGGCAGNYTYRWQTSEPQPGSGVWSEWADAGNTGDTFYYYHNNPRNLQVRCLATDACGNVTELYDGFYTYYSDPNCGIAPQW